MIPETTRIRLAALGEIVRGGDRPGAGGRWLILTHDNPDPDALAAAALLARLLRGAFRQKVTLAYGGLVGRAENREMVRKQIDALPEGYRTVLVLRDIEGLDTEETANVLGLSVNATKIRLHRARQALRTLLAPHFRSAAS